MVYIDTIKSLTEAYHENNIFRLLETPTKVLVNRCRGGQVNVGKVSNDEKKKK